MARQTEIADGKHLLKPSGYAGAVRVTIPRELAAAAGIDGNMFVGAMVVGKCIVIAQVNRTIPEEFAEELDTIFDRATKLLPRKARKQL